MKKKKKKVKYVLMIGNKALLIGNKDYIYKKYNSYLELGILNKDMYIKEINVI